MKKKKTAVRHHIDRRAEQVAASIGNGGAADEMLDTIALARWLGCSIQWLEIGRSRGWGPSFVRIGVRCIRYRRGDVVAWLQSRTHSSTNEYNTNTSA